MKSVYLLVVVLIDDVDVEGGGCVVATVVVSVVELVLVRLPLGRVYKPFCVSPPKPLSFSRLRRNSTKSLVPCKPVSRPRVLAGQKPVSSHSRI